MARYDIPVQENGRMILPAELRRALGVGKGDRVVILTTEDGVELTTVRRARRRAQERFRRLMPGGWASSTSSSPRSAPRSRARTRCARRRPIHPRRADPDGRVR